MSPPGVAESAEPRGALGRTGHGQPSYNRRTAAEAMTLAALTAYSANDGITGSALCIATWTRPNSSSTLR
jgi:hypothetical protein